MVLPLRQLTHWHSIFPLDFAAIFHLLKGMKSQYRLGISRSSLDAIEDDFSADVEKGTKELVRVWLSSTPSLEPPCWWKLVQALRQLTRMYWQRKFKWREVSFSVLAEKIQMERG